MHCLAIGAKRTSYSMASELALGRSSLQKLSFVLLFFILCTLYPANSQETGQFRSCYTETGSSSRCVPRENAYSLGRPVTTNNTCGAPPSTFCERVSFLTLLNIQLNCTRVCNTSNPALSHPASALVDFDLGGNTFWQSRTVDIEEDVVINIPLGLLVEIELVTVNFSSFAPESFYIEKSTDGGVTFEPYHYFSMTCMSTYGLTPDGVPTLANEGQPLCTSLTSPRPQLLSFVPAALRPSANDSIPGFSESVYQFLTATDLRIVLDRQYVVDNQPPSDPQFRDSYYYAIPGITVIGALQCHGHANSTVTSDNDRVVCQCTHNTTGDNCELCREFHQDVPWQRHLGSDQFVECKMCECNNHSNSCEFNATAYSHTGSGGVCLNCTHNTVGQHCEECDRYYYQNTSKELTDPTICIECSCHLPGVLDGGDCVRSQGDGVSIGDCYCKSFTTGRRCDQCRVGYFNLLASNPDGCMACGCDPVGSVSESCDQLSGVCQCRDHVVGVQCDSCEPGFYNLSSSGCQPCMCVPGASVGTCDPVSGQCSCRSGMTGMNCGGVLPGRFLPALDYLLLEAEFDPVGMFTLEYATSGVGTVFTGWGHSGVSVGSVINFGTILIPHGGVYQLAVRYSLSNVDAWQSAVLNVRPVDISGGRGAECSDEITMDTDVTYDVWPMGTALSRSEPACLRGGHSYEFILHIGNSGALANVTDINFFVDSLVVVPSLPDQLDTLLGNTSQFQTCSAYWEALSTLGMEEAICEQLSFSVLSQVYNGSLLCNCGRGSTNQNCSSIGGQCSCGVHASGRDCSYCSPGSYGISPEGCRACNCDSDGSESDVCAFDTGDCQCRPFVTGLTCSQCEEGYYNISSGSGCVSCGCDVVGTAGNQCDPLTGMCSCKVGVTGLQCDSCLPSHYNLTENGCSGCACSEDGALSNECSNDTGQCHCKQLTSHPNCGACVDGSFNLLKTNPFGCQPCFCSGLDVPCTSAPGYTSGAVSTTFTVDTMYQWGVVTSDLTPAGLLFFDPIKEVVLHQSGAGTYITAPDQYLGNKLSSYGQAISFTYRLDQNQTTSPPPMGVYDVLIVGSSGTAVGAYFLDVPTLEPVTSSILIQSGSGWTNTVTGSPSSAVEILSVLNNIRTLAVRVEFGVNLVIYNISLVTAVLSDNGSSDVSWVESCACPANYSGLSCEGCSTGYYRAEGGTCQPCQCNGLATTCNLETGECTNCLDLTTGFSCERCVEGAFGDPVNNISCRPCPCPLTTDPGQFSRTCRLVPGGAECIECPEGHAGRNCELCAEGYFGDPTGNITGTPFGCSDCLCNNNIDLSVPDSCNRTSGECLVCTRNTSGTSCERCRHGFYGDAIEAKNCTECACSIVGSLSDVCDSTTGQCSCLPFVSGRDCSQCDPGYYGISSGTGCDPCQCNEVGSVSSQCSPSGDCSCKPLVTGRACDQCQLGAYNFSDIGCTVCDCHVMGTVDGRCSFIDGQCDCRHGYRGLKCDLCEEGFYQIDGRCDGCPQCYLQLQELLNISDVKANNLSDILSGLESSLPTNDFISRFNAFQNVVSAQRNWAQSLKTNDSRLEALIAELEAMLIKLGGNVSMAAMMLGDLNSTTTTISARVATIETTVFSLQSMLNGARVLLENMTFIAEEVGNITVILEELSDSSALTVLELTRTTLPLIEEANRLILISLNTTTTANVTRTVAMVANLTQAETSNSIISLVTNTRLVQARTSSLLGEVGSLLMRGQNIREGLNRQLVAPFSPPSESLINSSSNHSSIVVSWATRLQEDLFAANISLDIFGDTLLAVTASLDTLAGNVSAGSAGTGALDFRVVASLTSSLTVLNKTNVLLTEAQEIAVAVESFSQQTNLLETDAQISLGQVSRIREIAEDSLQLSVNITQMLSEAAIVLRDANTLSISILNELYHLEQNVSSLNLSSTPVSGDQITSSQLLSSLLTSMTDIQVFVGQLDHQSGELAQAANLTGLVGAVDEASQLAGTVNVSVSDLLVSLSNLVQHNSTTLEDLLTSVTQLSEEVESTDMSVVIATLEQQLTEQKLQNDHVVSQLEAIEREVASLRQLHQSLPLSCDSNI